jgi:hypothetical protein
MSGDDIVRAWKDPAFRSSDIDHPAGEISLAEPYEYVGGSTEPAWTAGCGPYGGGCGGLTNFNGTCTCTWGPSCTAVSCGCEVWTNFGSGCGT